MLDAVLTGGRYAGKGEQGEKFQNCEIRMSGLRFCVGTGSALAENSSISLEQIAEQPLALLDLSYPLQQSIEELFSARDLKLDPLIRTSQMFTIERFIAEGVAGGFLPEEALEGNRRLKALHCPEINAFRVQPIRLYWKEQDPVSQPLKNLINSAKKLKSVQIQR